MSTTAYRADHSSGQGAESAPGISARGSRFVLLAFLAFSLGARAAEPRFVPGQILVKPRAQLSEPEFAARVRFHGASHRQTLRHINVRVLNLPEGRAEMVLAALRNDPGIEFAERDGLAQAAFFPNDPYFVSGSEWHLARIQAPQAWNYAIGSTNIVVAILDSGINAAHPDLAGRVLPGFDFLYYDTDTSDIFGHGTAVAGVVAAGGNNGLGVAGVAYGCSLLPVRVVDGSGFATYSSIAQGLKYAVDQGARVVNISIAGNSSSSTLQDAINYAWSNNVVVVAAAGNNANALPQYPAACDHVVAVAATEPDDNLTWFSSYGSFVALSAPGDNIWTTQRDLSNPYGPWKGTSFSSPMVAAAAALVASVNPSLSNTQIVSLLEQTADDLGPAGYDQSFGYGRLNVFRALSAISPQPEAGPSTPPAIPPTITLTSPLDGSAFVTGAKVALAATAAANSGNVTSVVFMIGGIQIAAGSAPPFTAGWIPLKTGSFPVTALASDDQGLCSTSAPVTIRISRAETIAPSIRITSAPPNGARLSSPDVSFSGTASDNSGVDHVEVQINNGLRQPTNGTTNWNAQLVLAPGTNVVRVRSVDLAGNVSPEVRRFLTYVVPAPLTLLTNGVGTVTPDLNGSVLEIGKNYTLTAVPGPGQVFAGWDGASSPSPVLTFVMQSNLTLVANFVPTPFGAVKGGYAGLVADTNGVSPDSSGFFTLAVTGMGRFTGKLLSGGSGYGFQGQFNLAGEASVTVRRGRLNPLTMNLRLELTNSSDTVGGSVSGGTWTSDLSGGRNVFDARNNPARQAGSRAFILEPAGNSATVAATGSSQISAAGAARVRGRLCDGRLFATASTLAKNGDCPFYLSLNHGREVVIGWLNFPAGQDETASGTVLWVRTGSSAFSATLQASSVR